MLLRDLAVRYVLYLSAGLAVALYPLVGKASGEEHPIPKQRRCGTMPAYDQLFAEDVIFRKKRESILGFTLAYKSLSASARIKPRTTLIRIPIVVHVVYN